MPLAQRLGISALSIFLLLVPWFSGSDKQIPCRIYGTTYQQPGKNQVFRLISCGHV